MSRYIFWPFKSKPEDKDTDEKLAHLEKRMNRLEEDWSEVYGKFRTMQMRVAKQVQRLDQAPEGEAPQATESDDASPTTTGLAGTSLSPRAQQIQKQILERRNRLEKGGTE